MSQIYKTAIVAIVLLNLVQTLINANLAKGIFIAAVIIVLFGLPFIGSSFRKITIIFFLAGLTILIWSKLPLDTWMAAFNSMTGLIAILTVMQLFTIPIEAGKYNSAVGHLLKRVCQRNGSFYLFVTLITNIFSSILSMGSVPIMHSLIEDSVKKRIADYKRFIATAISRGFALSTLWAPGAATIFLVGQVTGVGWAKIFLPGLFLALLGIAVSGLLEFRRFGRSAISQNSAIAALADDITDWEKGKAGSKVWHIAGAIGTVVLLTLLFIRLNIGASSSSAVVLSGFLVFLVWILLLRKEPQLKSGLANYWSKNILKAADLAPFFVAIGVFSGAFQNSGLAVLLERSLQGLAHSLGVFAVILIPLAIMVLALVGLHPFISVVLLGQILMTLNLPLPALTLALCLNLGGSIAYMVSPFAGIIMTMAKFTDASAVDIAIRWNWLFCIIYFILGISLAYFLGMVYTS